MAGFDSALAQQDILGLAEGWYYAAKINIQPDGLVYLETYQQESPGTFATNQFINLNEQNPVTEALTTIRENVLADIEGSQILQDLLAKPSWDYNDRTIWESHVSRFVSERYNEIAGLDVYRAEGLDPVQRVEDFAGLATDILNQGGNSRFENDCETMSSLEGIILTQIEEALLPETGQSEDDLKISGAYVLASGGVKYSPDQDAGGHAFIISSLTGNIIEGTADPDTGYLPYNDTGADYSYADFIAGHLAVTQSVEFFPSDPSTMTFGISVYGSYYGEADDDVIAHREELIQDGDYEGLIAATFGHDSDADNEQYFLDAFYQAGNVQFTVTKPGEEQPSPEPEPDDGPTYYDGYGDPSTEDEGSNETVPEPEGDTFESEIIEGTEIEETKYDYEELITEDNQITTQAFDEAFFGGVYGVLEENGFTESGDPAILVTEDGEAIMIIVDPENGDVSVYDVTGEDFGDLPILEFEVEETNPQPEPEPEPWPTPPSPEPTPEPQQEICTQLHNVSFAEFVDGKGILNDEGYNDGDALRDLVQAAKGLGLSEAVYGHIEEAMTDGKFLETAASIRAIEAAHTALQSAQAAGMSDIETERLVVSTFFENITAEDLIVDTDGIDDRSVFTQEQLQSAREHAAEMDAHFTEEQSCGLVQTWDDAIEQEAPADDDAQPEPEQNQPEALQHEVSRGESYSALARRYYGSASPEIYNALAAHNGHDADSLPYPAIIEIPATLNDEIIRNDLRLSAPENDTPVPGQ